MEAYQTLFNRYPRVRLTSLPSPLERVDRAESTLGDEGMRSVPRLWLKRDDLLSLGMGGNKIRNLEFSLGAALKDGATDIITAGRVQSNHCRLTAAACARTGLRAHLVLSGAEPPSVTGNLLLDGMLGARTYFTGNDDRDARAALVERVARDIRATGGNPHVLPVGGSDARGALGHALAALELLDQCRERAITPAAIVLATATGGTQAGMLAGLRLAGTEVPIHGFAVARSAPELHAEVLAIARSVAHDIGAGDIDHAGVLLDDGQLGAGYGAPTAAGTDAITWLARSEGVFADPVYTGKALAGLRAMIAAGAFSENDDVIFVHTGGAPALFSVM